jgi:hypothetical protein
LELAHSALILARKSSFGLHLSAGFWLNCRTAGTHVGGLFDRIKHGDTDARVFLDEERVRGI